MPGVTAAQLKFLDLDSHSEFAAVEEKLNARLEDLKKNVAGAGDASAAGTSGPAESDKKGNEGVDAASASGLPAGAMAEESDAGASATAAAPGPARGTKGITDAEEMQSCAEADALARASKMM